MTEHRYPVVEHDDVPPDRAYCMAPCPGSDEEAEGHRLVVYVPPTGPVGPDEIDAAIDAAERGAPQRFEPSDTTVGVPVITVLNDEVTVSIDAADYDSAVLTSIGDAVADDQGERIFELTLTMATGNGARVLTLGSRISEDLLDRLASIFAAHALR